MTSQQPKEVKFSQVQVRTLHTHDLFPPFSFLAELKFYSECQHIQEKQNALDSLRAGDNCVTALANEMEVKVYSGRLASFPHEN